jgi:hypothetical protein
MSEYTASEDQWATYWGSPVTDAPDDPTVRYLLTQIPEGLVVNEDVLTEFHDAPKRSDPGNWFCGRAWDQFKRVFNDDPNSSQEDISESRIAWEGETQDKPGIKAALQSWVYARADYPDGETRRRYVSANMQSAGTDSLERIRSFQQSTLEGLSKDPKLEDTTKNAIENFSQVLSQYIECIALEFQSEVANTSVSDARTALKAATPNGGWEPVVTPDNLDSKGIDATPSGPGSGDDTGTGRGEGSGTGKGDGTGTGTGSGSGIFTGSGNEGTGGGSGEGTGTGSGEGTSTGGGDEGGGGKGE